AAPAADRAGQAEPPPDPRRGRRLQRLVRAARRPRVPLRAVTRAGAEALPPFLDDDLPPLRALVGLVDLLELSPRLEELLVAVPLLPVLARLPRPDDHPLVRRALG